jgi:hypothetical protein
MVSLNGLFAPILGVLAAGRLLLPPGGWEGHAPPFRHVTDIAVSAKNGLVVYATADDAFQDADGLWHYPSAVFRTADGGSTWTKLATAPDGDRAKAIAIDPFDPLHLIAATDGPSGSHIYLTRDGGITWVHVVDTPGCSFPSLAFDSTFAGRAYADCGRLLRSDDGTTWTTLDVSIPATITTDATGAVYAVASDRILRSTDHGASWTRIMDAPTGCPSIMALAVDPGDSGILYVGTGRNFFGRFECGGVYKSLDGGHTLTRTPLPDQFVTGVTLDATDSSIVYTCSVYSGGFFSGPALVSRSLDGAQSWHAFSQIGLELYRLVSTSKRLLYGSGSSGVVRRSTLEARGVPARPPR